MSELSGTTSLSRKSIVDSQSAVPAQSPEIMYVISYDTH